ncbi:MAG: HlyD family efflux transporter periplasmic adaptor subunit [Gammaproteobacteria bacterium]|nr:HlyD family efflux transporter periplasmic adaptor subunit [Gammaproteobacteria bacterium]
MTAIQRRITFWAVLIAFLMIGLVYGLWPRAVLVDLLTLERGELRVSIDEEGETRVRDVFTLSAPVAGRVRRIELDPGDEVIANETIIAEIEPIDPEFLDPRSTAQAEAGVEAAKAAKTLAEASVQEAKAELEFAEAELQRNRKLFNEHTVAERTLDDAERTFKTRSAALGTARAMLQMRIFELEHARAQLMTPIDTQDQHGLCHCIPIRAPVNGRILQVLHENAGVVRAGEALVDIGDPTALEIVVDLLSSDAVKVRSGQTVIIEEWGGEGELKGQVRRVEPFGFTKVSALGIEEQRVNVIIDFNTPAEQWARLGHGYQVEVKIVIWEGTDVLKLPLTALFRDNERWAVYKEENGRAQLRYIQLGRRTGLEAKIIDGLEVGDQVVAYPSDRVMDKVRISVRNP